MSKIFILLFLTSCASTSVHLFSLNDYDAQCWVVKAEWDGKARICDSEFERDRSLYGRD